VQRNCDSLSKLCQLRRINIRCRIVCCAANCDSLPKLCRLQRINNSLPSGVFCSELAIHCRTGCLQRNSFRYRIGKPAVNQFSLPNWLPAAKQFSLPNWLPAANQFSLPKWLPAAKQFSLPNWAACSEPVLTADFYNKPPRHK